MVTGLKGSDLDQYIPLGKINSLHEPQSSDSRMPGLRCNAGAISEVHSPNSVPMWGKPPNRLVSLLIAHHIFVLQVLYPFCSPIQKILDEWLINVAIFVDTKLVRFFRSFFSRHLMRR